MSGPSVPGSRLARASRWLAPSIVAAFVGVLVAGVVDGIGMDSPLHIAAATGFLAMVAVPALFVLGVAARGVFAAWRPRTLIASLVDGNDAAPALAGWVGVLWLGTALLAYAVYRGTWWLASFTTFKPMPVGFGVPLITVSAALVLLGLSRPAARWFARVAERIDGRWRAPGRTSLLTPWRILAGAAVAWLVGIYLVWRFGVRPRIGPLDTSVATAPFVGVLAVALIHAVWPRLRHRVVVGAAFTLLGLATLGLAVFSLFTRPSMTLEIWGDRPLTGLAIDGLFDLEKIRADIDLAEFRPVDAPGAEHPDILLITIDTVRADHTPPYGGKAEMPALAGLGSRGTVFTWAFAPSNVTRRSIPSMVIGLAPTRIKGRVVGWALRVDPRHVLLAERLRAGGYETAGFMCCHGFWSPEVRTGLQRGLEHLEIEMNGSKLAKAARTWLDEREARPSRRPLFLWMHVIEPHNWTQGIVEPRNDEERTRLYDRMLTASDQMLAEVLRPFARRSPELAPIVVVTADHGEALGEHGEKYHSTDLYNSQIRVPLVFAGPGIKQQAILETVSLTDLVPTLLELAGFELPSGSSIDGRSIADLAQARRPSGDGGTAFAAMIKDRSNPGGVLAVVKGRWKLIETGDVLELYDIHADPGELSNLVTRRPDIVAELRAMLEAKKVAASVSPFD